MRTCLYLLVTLVGLPLLVDAAVVELTPDNFDDMTNGKSVFVKFYDPNCGHCKKMEPAWKELGEAFPNSKSKLIAQVDCTDQDQGSLICAEYGVNEFPTLRFGPIYDLQEYEGPRDFNSLKKFADKHVKAQCGPDNMQLCDKATRQEIRRLLKLSKKEFDNEVKKVVEEYNALEKAGKAALEDIERQYDAAEAQMKVDRKKIKPSLDLMKAVLTDRKKEQ